MVHLIAALKCQLLAVVKMMAREEVQARQQTLLLSLCQ